MQDNGVKLVDPYGEMLEQSWEEHATKLANAESDDDLVNVIQDIIVNTGLDGSNDSSIVYARDTRFLYAFLWCYLFTESVVL